MDPASHISVILDLSPSQWHLAATDAANPLSLKAFLSQILIFFNSHLAAKDENTLAVFGAFPSKSVMLYPSQDTAAISVDANSYLPFKTVDQTVVQHIMEEMDNVSESLEEEPPVQIVNALTKALCYINRITHPSSSMPPGKSQTTPETADPSIHPDPRILIISVSPDLSTVYIPMMNAIFSAQKLKVTIDVCKVFGSNTVFLQQAAHLTGGSYIYLERRDALLQYLIMSFLPPPSLRQILSVPTQDRIDYRAACFCHKNIVDVGFVCSVCLSIFCSPVPICTTCRTKFPIKTLQRLNAARTSLPSSAANSGPPTPSRAPTPAGQRIGADSSSLATSGLPSTHSINTNGNAARH